MEIFFYEVKNSRISHREYETASRVMGRRNSKQMTPSLKQENEFLSLHNSGKSKLDPIVLVETQRKCIYSKCSVIMRAW
jgi:hypothetical protein